MPTAPGIGDIELELQRTGAATGSLVITIYSDNAGVPGSQFGTFKITVPESSIPTTETLFDFRNISLSQPLTIGTKYWVDVARSGSVTSETFVTTRANTGSSSTAYFRGASPTLTTSSLAICISDDHACDAINVAGPTYDFQEASQQTTPEPASVALVGIGLIGIGAAKRRLSQRKSASPANTLA